MSSVVRWTRVIGSVSAFFLNGCADTEITAPKVNASQVVASVTPQVAAQLDASGKFVFAVPENGDVPWITAQRARDLAVAYWKGYGPSVRSALAEERDANVSANLVPCRRVFLAESGYEAFALDVHPAVRRTFGPVWLVSLCHGSEQQVAVAISVEAVDVTIDDGGIIRGLHSGDLASVAVPVGTQFPLEPELGAVSVAQKVDARVSAVPVYRRKARKSDAFSGIWTYSLESSVPLRGAKSGADIDTNAVGFARWESMYNLRPVTANPDSASAERAESTSIRPDGQTPIVYQMLRRLDVPASLEAISLRRTP